MINNVTNNYTMVGDLIITENNTRSNNDRWRDQRFRKYKDISGFMNGDFTIHLENVNSVYVDDIFELTDFDTRSSLLVDMLEPIKISMKAIKSCNDKRITFEIGISEVSDPEEISVLTLPRNKLMNVEAWIERELGDYQGVNQPVREYVTQAIETLAPVLEKRAFALYEKDSIVAVYTRIVDEVRHRAQTQEGFKDPSYQIKQVRGQGEFVCIKGKSAFHNLLMAIEADYQVLELLKKLEAMGLLLVNSGRHYDFRFDGGWWYYIRYDEDLLIKGEETGDYE